MESPQPFEAIVTPEETVLTFGDGTFRHIFTDGRGHPSKDELWPTVTGHLNALKDAGLVDAEKDGTSVRYRLNISAAEEAVGFLMEMMRTGADAPNPHPVEKKS